MAKKIESIKHKGDTRPYISSKEKAGYLFEDERFVWELAEKG